MIKILQQLQLDQTNIGHAEIKFKTFNEKFKFEFYFRESTSIQFHSQLSVAGKTWKSFEFF